MKNRTLQPSISNVNSSILLSFKNFLLTSGYGSGHKDLIKSQILAKKKKKKKKNLRNVFFIYLHNGTEAQGFQEAEISVIGETGPEDAIIDHREIQRRNQQFQSISVVDRVGIIVSGQRRSPRIRRLRSVRVTDGGAG